MNNEIVALFRKFQDNQCHKEEIEQVLQYIQNKQYLAEWDAAIAQSAHIAMESAQVAHMPPETAKAIHERIMRHIKTPKIRPYPLRIYWAAAALVATLAVSWYFYPIRSKKSSNYTQKLVKEDIKPGHNQAVLQLADGRIIALDTAKNTVIVTGSDIHYSDGASILRQSISPASTQINEGSDPKTLSSISTPVGGQYQIILPDGTQVWLNARTTLRYPTHFSKNNRFVELEGEAYFSVKKQAANAQTTPFTVKSSTQEITVLGTEFNINSFSRSRAVKTTLVSGALKITPYSDEKQRDLQASLLLKPGEQSIVSNTHIRKVAVPVNQEIAWKNGRFSFDGKSFPDIMDELSRWYGVEVNYQGPLPHNQLFGGMFRNKNFSSFIHILETTSIPFQVDYAHKLLTLQSKAP